MEFGFLFDGRGRWYWRHRAPAAARNREHKRHVLITFARFADGFEPDRLRVYFPLRRVLFRFGVVPFHSPNSRGRRPDFPHKESFAILVLGVRGLLKSKGGLVIRLNGVRRERFVIAALFPGIFGERN